MRRIRITLAFCICFMLISCSPSPYEHLIGGWKGTMDGDPIRIIFMEGNKVMINDEEGIYVVDFGTQPASLILKGFEDQDIITFFEYVENNKIRLELGHIAGHLSEMPTTFSEYSILLTKYYSKEDITGNRPTDIGIQFILDVESAFARQEYLTLDTVYVRSTKMEGDLFKAMVTMEFISKRSGIWLNEGQKDPIPNTFRLRRGRNSVDVTAIFSKYDDAKWHLEEFVK